MPKTPSPKDTADTVARSFFGVEADPASRSSAARQMLVSAVYAAVLTPALFLLRFGEVGPLGWGLTVFFVMYCVLAAIGLYFGPHTEYHSRVPLRNDWLDKIGAFWLMACVFGPFFGWIVASAVPITADSWRGVYGVRVFLAAGLPLITMLPLTRYARGKAALIALPMLIGVTLLALWTAVDAGRDLVAGPIERQTPNGQTELYLKYTDQHLGSAR
ncbi:MAG: hypothetical protein KA765_07225 [Thermoflexales bacterium]|nr:hypothetical protein [Thermoflexales bacterium]